MAETKTFMIQSHCYQLLLEALEVENESTLVLKCGLSESSGTVLFLIGALKHMFQDTHENSVNILNPL